MLVYSTRKTPVGSHADAEKAAYGSLDYLDDGLFKKVYVSPDGTTVYKVTRGYSHEDAVTEGRANALIAEAAWAAALKGKVPGIPPVSLWLINGQPVLSMPYYPRDARELDWDVRRTAVQRWEAAGLDDIHEGNFRGDKRGRPKVIDLGGWGNCFPEDALPSEVYDQCRADIYDDPDEDDGYDLCPNCGDRMDDCECEMCPCCDEYVDAYCECVRCDECGECVTHGCCDCEESDAE